MGKVKSFVLICFTLFARLAAGQCPVPNFSVGPTACLQEQLLLTNSSVGAVNFNWDFCAGDMELLPSGSVFLSSGSYGSPYKVEVIKAAQNFVGFFLSRNTHNLYRLEFGTTLSNVPTVINVGDLGLNEADLLTIEIVQQGNQFYGLMIGYSNKIYRLSFGTDILSTPVVTDLGNTGVLNGPIDMVLRLSASGNFIALVPNLLNGTIAQLNFGGSMVNPPSLTSIGVPGANGLSGISVIQECDQWYGIVTSQNNNAVFELGFGTDLSSTPSVTQLSGLAPLDVPTGVALVFENAKFYAFIQSNQTGASDLFRLSFGSSMSNAPSVSDLGNLGVLEGNFGFSIYQDGSTWIGFSSVNVGSQIHKIAFQNPCFSDKITSNLTSPIITTNQSGTFYISVAAINGSGNTRAISKSVTINALIAPAVDFSTNNFTCMNSGVSFTPSGSPSINSYSWDFGDMTTATIQNPVHAYTATGSFNIGLSVGSTNGCGNFIQKSLQIFNPPVADFTLPSANPICTNQNYTFVNTSSFDAGSNPSWQWSVNGSPVSSAQDLIQAFSNTTTQSVELVASIPGCSAQKTQDFTVQLQGPFVDFSASNGCQGKAVQFTNNSSGTISGYSWTFGDGSISAMTNPQNTYSNIGTYTVSLAASDASGCNNSSTKQLTVYTTPQAGFSLDLPPFSCSGTPSQFHDTTPLPTDSNLSIWSWNFGDAANGTSTQESPAYTYADSGVYNVSFSVTTDFGCSAAIQKQVTIAGSPVANFTRSAACINEGTQFTDASGPGIKSWVWQIGNSFFFINNPVYVFSAPNTYNVQMTVTGNNNCIGQATKSVVVPVPLVPDFSSQSTCAGKNAVFSDATPVGSDAPASWGWDFGGQGIASGSSVQFIFPSTGNYSVTMKETAQSGCTYSVTKTISVVTAPEAGFTASADAGEPPLDIQFTNTSSNASSYVWHFNDSLNSMSVQASPSFTFVALGDYVVDLTAFGAQGCSDTFSQIIHVVIPRIDAALLDLQLVRDNVTGDLRASFSIQNNGNLPLDNPTIVLDISGSASIQQNLNLTLAPGQTTSQALNYSVLPDGLNYICVSVAAAGDVDLFNDKQCLSLNQEEIIFGPYPNPCRGELHLDWIASGEATAQITIFNSTGAKAFDRQLPASSAGLNQIVLDVSNLNQGVYMVMVVYSGTKKTFRFVVD